MCQKFFLSTLCIDEQRVKTALRTATEARTVIEDLRGRHCSSSTTDREERVPEHIKSFKCLESHYSRAETTSQFLPVELSVKKMHTMYIKWCAEMDYHIESYDFYRRVFLEKFDLKFHKPKKDMCDTCEGFKNLQKTGDVDGNARRVMGTCFTGHQ